MTLIAALLAAAGLAQGAQAAGPIRADLDRGYWAVQDLGRCMAALPDGEARYEAVMGRFWAAYERAEGLYGPDPEARTAPDSATQPACSAGFAAASEAGAVDAFTQAERGLAAAEAPLARGLWAGRFRMCAETVAAAELVRRKGEAPVARLTVGDAAVAALAAWSGSEDTPARLAVRLDGAVVAVLPLDAAPGAKLEVEGPDVSVLARAVAAAKGAC